MGVMKSAPSRGWILLAEDDEDVRRLISVALRDEGYAVSEACDGLELFNYIGASVFDGGPEPDVVIADVRMPYFTGTEVLGCAARAEVKAPFILITAHWDPASCAEVHRLGARAVFYKPFDIEDLLTMVANLTPRSPPTPAD